MHLLRWVFMLLTLCGCWRPISWTSQLKKRLYTMCTIVSMFFLNSFLLSLILDLIFNVDNQEDFSDNIYVTLEVFASSWKVYMILKNQRNYATLMDTLQEEPLAPMNTDEIETRTRFDKLAQQTTIVYAILLGLLLILIIAAPIFADFDEKKLTCRGWFPYDYSTPLTYIITHVYQSICVTISAYLNVAGDCLFSGLLIHTYCLFEIFGYRLKNIIKDGNDSVKQCVRLHNHIYKFATTVNEEFKSIIFVQFLVSTAILCIQLYRLTQEMDSKFMETVVYTTCTFVQILRYCWYGNEVREKSLSITDMVIESNWAPLDSGSKKILLMIMKRATVPIEFKSIHVASMDLASFMVTANRYRDESNELKNKQF